MNFHFFLFLSLLACDSDKGVTRFNSVPQANISSHANGAELKEGYTVLFEGWISDPNHSAAELEAKWQIDGETACDFAPGNEEGYTFCESVIGIDSTQINLIVQDPEAATGDDVVWVEVSPTESPDAEIIQPSANGVYASNQLIIFEGVLSDKEDLARNLIGTWTSNEDGVLADVTVEPNDEGQVIGYGMLTEGQHAIELQAEDRSGKRGTASVIITVGPANSTPACEITTPASGSAFSEGELVDFAGSVSDSDDVLSELSVSWASSLDGELGTSTADSGGGVVFSTSSLSVNTHIVTMKVRDPVGSECVAEIEVMVDEVQGEFCGTPVSDEILELGEGLLVGSVLIPNGVFIMGSPDDEIGRENSEVQHEVTLTHNFYMMTTELTQDIFEELMGYNPSFHNGPSYINSGCSPVESVSWYEAAAAANELTNRYNSIHGSSLQHCFSCTGSASDTECVPTMDPYLCTGYRLPTEAEWEYAARSGTSLAIWTENGGGNLTGTDCITTLTDGSDLQDYAWYCANTVEQQFSGLYKMVGQKLPNAFGLHDMSGNVWEWVWDWVSDYPATAVVDPSGPDSPVTENKGYRGGGSNSSTGQTPYLRAAYRSFNTPFNQASYKGFRLVRSAN